MVEDYTLCLDIYTALIRCGTPRKRAEGIAKNSLKYKDIPTAWGLLYRAGCWLDGVVRWPTLWAVAIYLDDRAYGGAEEGGWWYDCGTLVHKWRIRTSFSRDYAQDLADRLQDWCDELNVGRPSISSMSSIGRYRVHVKPVSWLFGSPPRSYPTLRPHYE